MKKLVAILLWMPVFAMAQNPNYLKTTDYKVTTLDGITATDGSGAVTSDKKTVNVVYYDGLGRPIQKVGHLQSGTAKNIVIPIVYDASGVPVKNYLPYPSESTTLGYVDNTTIISSLEAYYNTQYGTAGQNPYSEVALEASPFRSLQQQAAPGADWRMPTLGGDPDHTIRFDYQTNIDDDVRKYFSVATNSTNPCTLSYGNSYAAGELTKTILKNENWVSNQKDNTVEEFRDKENRVVLKRTYNSEVKHDTYYVYDQYGNLTFVIPPIVNTSGAVSANDLQGYCYHYKYDERNRLIEKQIPGKGREYIIYDKLNRIVATGPARSPFSDESKIGWMIIKYDVFNRPVVTGWMPVTSITSLTRNTLQAENDSHSTLYTSETKIQNTATVTVNGMVMQYDNSSWPNSTTSYHILTINYYDDYNFPNATIDFTSLADVYFNATDKKPKGLPTASLVRVLTTKSNYDCEKSYILYDKYGRVVRQHTDNHTGGYFEQDSKLDFVGKPLYITSKHKKKSSDSEISIKDSFSFTGQDRLMSHTHKIGDEYPQLLQSNSYNKLGQLIRKAVGGLDLTGVSAMQKVDYRYNIRGWLTDINDAKKLQISGDPKDLFGFKINYNTVENASGYEGKPQYNGNISETYWATAADDGVRRKYGYFYDNLNRLSEAVYIKPDNITPVTQSYNEKMSYNKNGNIRKLERYGNQDTNFPIKIDNLDYNYYANSNQLLSVKDSEGVDGFKNGVDTSQEYIYDAQGNLERDDNKGIQAIIYNHLNLPTSITFVSGAKIEYIYNAIGTKVTKKVKQSGVTQQTDYQGGFQYIGGRLAFFPTAEGYVDATGGVYKYVFQYKDHLGNIRVSYTQEQSGALKILEENNYYPFGMKHAGYNSSVFDYKQVGGSTVIDITTRNKSQYKYNGQEFQDELGLNMTAMDYRQYDNALGRFHGVDALAELAPDLTPYRFGFNNPVYWSDPTGLFESIAAARAYMNSSLGLTNSQYYISPDGNGGYNAYYQGMEFSDTSVDVVGGQLNEVVIQNGSGTSSSGVSSSAGSSIYFGFTASEAGTTVGALGVYTAALENRATYNINKIYTYGTKTMSNVELAAANAARMSKISAVANTTSKILGGASLGITGYQYATGQITGTEATVDAIMGVVGFMGPIGATISITYFVGKTLYEYSSGETLFEKPKN